MSFAILDDMPSLDEMEFDRDLLPDIPFDQDSDLICKLIWEKHQTLLDLNWKFGGLCELVCNRVLIDNILGKGEDINFLRDRLTVEKMDEEIIKKSHLLDVFSVFDRALAFLCGIYPDNIFSYSDQWKLVNTTSSADQKIRSVNRTILEKGLKNIEPGETLKLEVFRKEGLNFSGHALLVKKMEREKYIFFDPNAGEYRDLSFVQLSNKIDKLLAEFLGTDIFLTRGSEYIQRLKNLSDQVK